MNRLKKEKIVKILKKEYKNIDEKNLEILNEGRFANATVFRYRDENTDITIKDFSSSPWLVKNTLGRLFVKNEGNKIKALEDTNIVAKNVKFLSPYTLSFDFIKGDVLKKIENKTLDKDIFLEFEKKVNKMHEKNIVHLDLRNFGNIILGEDGKLYLIDFQSAIKIEKFPKKLKKILFDSDVSGVYKAWRKKASESLDPEREKFLEDFNEIRKLWILKGYPITKLIRKIKRKFM